MKISHTLTTQAAPAAIWSAWTNVENWPQWDSELVSAQLSAPFALAAEGQLTPKKGPTSRFYISQLDWGNSYTFTTQLPLCRLHVHRFITYGPPLSFTHEVSFEGPLAFAFKLILGKRFQKVLPGVMQQLKTQLEKTERS